MKNWLLKNWLLWLFRIAATGSFAAGLVKMVMADSWGEFFVWWLIALSSGVVIVQEFYWR